VVYQPNLPSRCAVECQLIYSCRFSSSVSKLPSRILRIAPLFKSSTQSVRCVHFARTWASCTRRDRSLRE
jgi:hypothetical protein